MAHTMEGFLEKKGSGGSVVGRTNWLKRWFVLDGSHLTYFEEFDPVSNKPKKQKGSLSVRGAKIEQVVKHHTREYCFGITRENGNLALVADAHVSSRSNGQIYGLCTRHAGGACL